LDPRPRAALQTKGFPPPWMLWARAGSCAPPRSCARIFHWCDHRGFTGCEGSKEERGGDYVPCPAIRRVEAAFGNSTSLSEQGPPTSRPSSLRALPKPMADSGGGSYSGPPRGEDSAHHGATTYPPGLKATHRGGGGGIVPSMVELSPPQPARTVRKGRPVGGFPWGATAGRGQGSEAWGAHEG